MIDNCSIGQLRLFMKAASLGSISGAASAFHLSQSAASTAIKRLEISLGVSLLEHGKNRFQLTAYGHQFLEKIKQLNPLLEEIEHLARSPEKGPWRLALSHSLGVAILPRILQHLQSKWPGIEIRLRIGHALTIATWVADGDVDVGVIIDQEGALPCERTSLFKGSYSLYGNKQLPATTPVLIDVKKQEALLLKSRYENEWKRPLPIAMDIPSWEVIAALTASGAGAGFLPNLMEISHPHLKKLSWKIGAIPYQVVALTRQKPEDALKHVVMELKSALKEKAA